MSRARSLNLQFDADGGVGPVAYILSALAHGAVILAIATWPQPSSPPPLLFTPVRLVGGLPAPEPPTREQAAAPIEEAPEPELAPESEAPAPAPEPEPLAPPPEPVVEPPPEPVVEPEPVPLGPEDEKQPEPPPEVPKPTPKPEPKVEPPPKRPVPTRDTPKPKTPDDSVVRHAGVAARFDGARLPHGQYLDGLVRRVSRSWLKPRTGQPPRPAIVYFEVSRTGLVQRPRIEQGSGVGFYDRAALRAVTLASPLPPLPPAYPHGTLKVHFEFIP